MVNFLKQAKLLLRDDEDALPDSVREVVGFASSRGIWYNLSRNKKCFSCVDAAGSRSRLGAIGIPIWDEFKTGIFKYRQVNGADKFLAVHCRGDREVSFDYLRAYLASSDKPERLPAEVLEDQFGMAYGRVTPFSDSLALDVFHIFDEDLLSPVGVPGTSMTNAGDTTWGIEFWPQQLVDELPNTGVARLSVADASASRRYWGVRSKKPIAFITGNGPDSGMLLWQMVNHEIRNRMGESFAGDVSMPPVTTYSIPEMGLSMELEQREDQTWMAIKDVITRACVNGAQIVALACNTTQYYQSKIEDLCRQWGVSYVGLVDAVEEYLLHRRVKRVHLAGIGPVVDVNGSWSAFSQIKASNLVPLSEEDVRRIEDLAFEVKRNSGASSNAQKLKQLLGKDFDQGRKSKRPTPILLALTELSLAMRDSGIWKDHYEPEIEVSGKVILDTLPIYGKAIAADYFDVSLSEMLS